MSIRRSVIVARVMGKSACYANCMRQSMPRPRKRERPRRTQATGLQVPIKREAGKAWSRFGSFADTVVTAIAYPVAAALFAVVVLPFYVLYQQYYPPWRMQLEERSRKG